MPDLSPEEREALRLVWERRTLRPCVPEDAAELVRASLVAVPRLAQPEAEREGLRVDLSMWSDETKRAIYYALHRDPACVPRSTAHGSGANPIAPPPDGRAG